MIAQVTFDRHIPYARIVTNCSRQLHEQIQAANRTPTNFAKQPIALSALHSPQLMLDKEYIKQLAEALGDRDDWDDREHPIMVAYHEQRIYIMDGNHRCEALASLGRKDALAIVINAPCG